MQDSSRPMAPRPPRPEPTKESGARVGRYELVYELATGGMGSVWAARSEEERERLVALKRVKKQLVSRAGMADRFEEAVRKASRIVHPNLCNTVDFLLHEGEPCIVSELLEAETLKALVRSAAAHRMPIPARISSRIVLDVLEGLGAAHELTRGEGAVAIHGDLSPENILVTTEGQAKILDFGLAKPLLGTPASPLKSREKAGYQAPEQIKSPATVDIRADLFAVGVLLWELATGERLFESKYEAAVAQKVLAAPIARLDALGKATPPLAKVVARALERDPSQRFGTAAEMAEALSEAAAGEIASAAEVAIVVDNLAGPQLAQRKRAIDAAIARLSGVVASAKEPASAPPIPQPAAIVEAEPEALEADDVLEESEEEEDEGIDVVIDESPPVSSPAPEPTPVPAPVSASTREPTPTPPPVSAPAPTPEPVAALSAPGDVVVADSIVIAKEAFEPAARVRPVVAPPVFASYDEDADEIAPSRRIDSRRARRLVFGIVGAAAGLLLLAAVLTASRTDDPKRESAAPASPTPAEPDSLKAVLSTADENQAPSQAAAKTPAPEPVEAREEPVAAEPEAAPEPEPTPAPLPPPPAQVAKPSPTPAPRPQSKPKAPAKPRKPAPPKPKAFDPSSI